MLKNNKGFGFIENITVIGVIGFLICLTIPIVNYAFNGTDILKNIINKRDVYIYYILRDEDKSSQAYNDFLDYSTKNIGVLLNNSKNSINSYKDLLDKLTDEEIKILKQQGLNFDDDNDLENIFVYLSNRD